MRNSVVLSCVLLAGLCAACRSASWVTHNDPLGFSVQTPAGWQVVGDRNSGRVMVSGPARQQAIVWPVFVPGAVDVHSAPAILRRLVAATGINAAWNAAPSPSANVARIIGAAGDRTTVASFAWVGSLKGAAGFLYVTAAPTASYTAEKEILSRILETFRATGAPAGAKASSGPAVKWVRWQDPKENAFSLEVPAEWTVMGGAFRFAPVDIRKTVQASSPDGRIRITGGDAELPTFTEPNQMLAMTGFREGSWYSPGYGVNMMVRRYTPGAQFAREYAATRAARGCANLTFTGGRDRPDVDGPLNRLMSGLAAVGGIMRIQSGEAAFTCEQNGQPASGYYFASSLLAGAAGMPSGIWHVEYLYGYVAARDQAAQAQQILSHMLVTYQDNPQWMAMQQNVTAATSRIVTQTQQEVSKMISDTFAYRNQVDDEISRRRENVTLGTVDVIDAASGRQFKVENSSNYYWLDNHGVIVGTETDTKPGWNFEQMTALP
jgi:hypothetical protein